MRRNSLVISSLFAATKAKNGSIDSLTDTKLIDYDISKKGLEELQNLENYLVNKWDGDNSFINNGYIQTKSFTMVGTPTIVVPSPKYLVGLGDTISLVSILYHVQFPGIPGNKHLSCTSPPGDLPDLQLFPAEAGCLHPQDRGA